MRLCPTCSSPIEKGRFCGKCGGRVPDTGKAISQRPVEKAPPATSEAPPSPAPLPREKQKALSASAEIDALAAAVKKYPASPERYIRLAEALMKAGKMDRAFSTFRAAKAVEPENPRVLRLGATILDAMGRRDEALELYNKVLKLDSRDIEATLEAAKLLHESGRRKKSLEKLQTLRDKASEHPEILLRMAEVQLSLGDASAAQADLSAYRNLAGGSREMYRLLGQAMLAQSFFDGAVRHYSEGLASFPEDTDLRLGLGKAYLGTNERGKALLEFERALQQNPNLPEILLEMGKLYGMMGMEDKVEEMFEKIRNQNLRNGEIFLEISRHYQTRGTPEKALQYLERARECSPHNPDVVKTLCEVVESQGDFQRAMDEYENFLTGMPKAEWALFGLVRSAMTLGEFARVAKAQKAILDLGNETPEGWCDFGETLIKLHKFKEAEKAFETAARIDPTCIRAYQAPELIRFEKARAEGEKLFQQGKEALQKKFLLTAVDRFEKALSLVPKKVAWMRLLAEVCLRIGSLNRASELLSKVRSHEPNDFWVGFQLARVYEHEEKIQLAIELLSSVLKDNPSDIDAHILHLRLKRSQIQGERFEKDMLNTLIRNLNAELAPLRKIGPVPLLVEGFANFIFGFGTRFQGEALRRAEELFDSVIRGYENNILANRGLSLVYRVQGDVRKATMHLQEAVKLSSDPHVIYSLARLNENFQAYAEARKCYTSLKNLFPENGLYRRRILEMMDKESHGGGKNELVDFLGSAQEQVKADANQPWLLYEIAWAQTLIARGSPQKDEWSKRALLSWNKANALTDPPPWIRWGFMEAQVEFLKGAERYKALNQNLKICEKLSREFPDLSAAHRYMGSCYLGFDDLAQSERALKHLEVAAFLEPTSAENLLQLARTYRDLGKSARVDAVRYAMILWEPELALKI